MKSVLSSLTSLSLLTGILLTSACTVDTQPPPAAPPQSADCTRLSAGAQVFLDDLIADMLDPASSFSHLPYLGEPEMQEVRARDAEKLRTDWGNLCQYKNDNDSVKQGPAPRAVFVGDSITEFWSIGDGELFGPGMVNRGISGQTSSQMLVRFWPDVIDLAPEAVHIMAGTNDLAENTGPVTDEAYKNNIRAMVTLAQSHDIAIVLASIPPAGSFGWRPDLEPPKRIETLNQWLEAYAAETGSVYVDYHSLLSTDGSSMSQDLTHDGVHPHRDGYAAMRQAAQTAIEAAIRDQ
ncbi:MAG: GDSL-type esterase/lipase family protein [Hyphomonas sp.]